MLSRTAKAANPKQAAPLNSCPVRLNADFNLVSVNFAFIIAPLICLLFWLVSSFTEVMRKVRCEVTRNVLGGGEPVHACEWSCLTDNERCASQLPVRSAQGNRAFECAVWIEHAKLRMRKDAWQVASLIASC